MSRNFDRSQKSFWPEQKDSQYSSELSKVSNKSLIGLRFLSPVPSVNLPIIKVLYLETIANHQLIECWRLKVLNDTKIFF